jgi:hypothetical protein
MAESTFYRWVFAGLLVVAVGLAVRIIVIERRTSDEAP